MNENQTILYKMATRSLKLWHPELRAGFTRDWFLYGRNGAVLRLASRQLTENIQEED